MRDVRPAAILFIYLFAVVGVFILTKDSSPMHAKSLMAARGEPKISIGISGDDTSTVEDTMTCEIHVSIDSAETTATIVDISDTISFAQGAALEVIDAHPHFEGTETIPGGGVKINWGSFELVGGETLSIKLRLRPKVKGSTLNAASVKAASGAVMSSSTMITFILPPKESTASITPDLLGFGLGQNNTDVLSGTDDAFGTGSNLQSLLGNPQGGDLSQQRDDGGMAVVNVPGGSSTGSSLTTSNSSKDSRTVNVSPSKNTATKQQSPAQPSGNPPGRSNIFADTLRGDWFEAYAGVLADLGIIKGYPDNTFRPNSAVGRAEFTALVMRAGGITKEGPEPFIDVVEGDWFYTAVASAYNLGLIEGVTENMFDPLNTLTREQAAAMSVKAAQLPLDSDGDTVNGWLQGFTDRSEISSWARPFVAASTKYNLLRGYPDGKFNPQNPITRAEAMALVHRLFFERRSMLVEFPKVIDSTDTGVCSDRSSGVS